MRVLLIEDEVLLGGQIKAFLLDKGFAVDVAVNGQEGLYSGLEFPVDLAIVDLGLPDISGIDVIKQLRAANRSFPVLILTARTRWQEKVEGLDAGADDYVEKPFRYEELWARLNALLRRSAGQAQPVINMGAVTMDTAAQTVSVNDVAIDLTAFEYKVLEYLMLHRGEVVTKTTLTEHLYDQDFDRDSNVIEVFIGRLRKKLDPDGHLQVIETLRGRGYRFSL